VITRRQHRFGASYIGDNNNTAVAVLATMANESVVLAGRSGDCDDAAARRGRGSISDSFVLSAAFRRSGSITSRSMGRNDADLLSARPVHRRDHVTLQWHVCLAGACDHKAVTYRFWASYSGDNNTPAVSRVPQPGHES